MSKAKYDDREMQECEDYFGCEYHVVLPTNLLPNEMKEGDLDVVLEVLECTAIIREPLYCDKCNTVIPSAMIQSTTRCPFCHKEF